eukprot:c28228_g1_i2 orf=951-2195(+)
MERLLQLTEEDDDASSSLSACVRLQTEQHPLQVLADTTGSERDYVASGVEDSEEEMLDRLLRSEVVLSVPCPLSNDESLAIQAHLRSPQLSLQEPFSLSIPSVGFCCAQDENSPPFFASQLTISSPPSAFLGPKCALWDCPRPGQGSEWYQGYCSNFHASLAVSEGAPGMSPVTRPGGIDLKDGPLFSALAARSHGKAVGIPECEGAATSKSPWNAPELFNVSVLLGEIMREWLFFDKPRRAFESGTRKQRSLPDYNGRGWHESRKQVMRDVGGLKRSYYMDPQPDPQFEWHLYEYELGDFDAWALYRLELKLADANKKNSKTKGQNDQVAALQHQIGRLSADLTTHDGKEWSMKLIESKGTNKGRNKSTQRVSNLSPNSAPEHVTFVSENHLYDNNASFGYAIEDVNNYLSTP